MLYEYLVNVHNWLNLDEEEYAIFRKADAAICFRDIRFCAYPSIRPTVRLLPVLAKKIVFQNILWNHFPHGFVGRGEFY